MTRKDYILIAEVFRVELERCDGRAQDGVAFAARSMALRLSQDNPRFDHDRFLKACGVTP